MVEDTKNAGMDKPAAPELYLSAHQVAQFCLSANMNFVVRTDGDPQALAPAVRAAVREVDPGLPVYGLRPMSEVVADRWSSHAFFLCCGDLFGDRLCSWQPLASTE